MNLAIDIGNTLIKAAVFDQGQVVETFKFDIGTDQWLDSILETYPDVDSSIMVSSGNSPQSLIDRLEKSMKKFILFNSEVPIPIKNLYKTPGTLGCDRLAAAVGANAIYPGSDVMIADFGTAITIDLVTGDGAFRGGNISPGASLRFRALHDHTSRLPLLGLTEDVVFMGASSKEAIQGGIVNGIIYELEGYIERLSSTYPGLRIIFTGGDGDFFAKRLKNTIFATYDLVVYGLNRILEYNAH